MTLDSAIRSSEVLLALALLQQSAEHCAGASPGRTVFVVRAALAVLLLAGVQPLVIEALFIGSAIALLWRFGGPYNGGSDRMVILVLVGLFVTHLSLPLFWREVALGYVAVQVVLSYWLAGWVKVSNPDWRSGRALRDVFELSAYPVTNAVRALVHTPRGLWLVSWVVMLFELLFPLALVSRVGLAAALAVALAFHLGNALTLGLNRFAWAWLASYPSVLWLQARVMGA